MAIVGLKKTSAQATGAPSLVEEAVELSVGMLQRLDLVDDEEELRRSLRGEFAQLLRFGRGRLYVRLPYGVKTSQLIGLANELALERGFGNPIPSSRFWVPGTEEYSLTEQELDGSTVDFQAQLALFAGSSSRRDSLLHFVADPYDRLAMYDYSSATVTQFERIERARSNFAERHPGGVLDTCDQRDYLAWYIMDLLRGVSASELVLTGGPMRVPRHGRRSVGYRSLMGCVELYGGMVRLVADNGGGGIYSRTGIGLSAGLRGGEW